MAPEYTFGAMGLVSGRGCVRPSFVVFLVFGKTRGSFTTGLALLVGGAYFLFAFPFVLDDGLGIATGTWEFPLEPDAVGVVAAILTGCSVDCGGSMLHELGVAVDGLGFAASSCCFLAVMEGSIGGTSIEAGVVSKLALPSLFIPSP